MTIHEKVASAPQAPAKATKDVSAGRIEVLQENDGKGGKRRDDKLWMVRLASVVFVFGMWEIFGRQANPIFMSYPTAILRAAVRMTGAGELQSALMASLYTLIVSFALATVIGIVLGLLIGRYRIFEAATDWIVSVLYATPLVALIPLIILWFGLGTASKIFVVTVLSVFPILINTAAGVKNVPAPFIDVGNAFAASEQMIFRKIIIPSALPYIMTGIRLGVGRAIIGMVVAEFFTTLSGLGGQIINYGSRYDTASMFVPIIVLMGLGVGLTTLARRAEQAFAPWKVTRD